jgi:RNA polymerase sigma-70 factor (ECF subfamily)
MMLAVVGLSMPISGRTIMVQENTPFAREALPQLKALREFALSLCKNQQRTDDLVQDTMVKAFRHFDSYRQGTNCRAWLFQICKHCFINDCRRRRYEPIAVDMEAALSSDGPEGEALRELRPVVADREAPNALSGLLSDEVARALEEIPLDYQTVLILSDIEGYSYDEIAEFVRAPLGTIRSRIHRGRRMLAQRLGEFAKREGYLSRTLAAA